MSTRLPVARRTSPAQVAYVLRDAIGRFNRRLRQTRPVADLTIAQLSVMTSLENAGALTPRELAEIERVQPPTMTRAVAKLEERELIRRSPHPTDGRQVILAPTPAGQALLAEFRRVKDEWLAQRLAKLSIEERETLLRAAELMARIARD